MANYQKPGTTGTIYFVLCNREFVKIGFTTKLRLNRMSEFRRHSPYDLEVVYWRPGKTSDEKMFHERFEHLRVRHEWFKFEGDLKVFISEHNLEHSVPPGVAIQPKLN